MSALVAEVRCQREAVAALGTRDSGKSKHISATVIAESCSAGDLAAAFVAGSAQRSAAGSAVCKTDGVFGFTFRADTHSCRGIGEIYTEVEVLTARSDITLNVLEDTRGELLLLDCTDDSSHCKGRKHKPTQCCRADLICLLSVSYVNKNTCADIGDLHLDGACCT